MGSTVCCANICPAPEPVPADPSRRRRQRAAAETCKCSHFRHAIPSTSHHDCALSCCVMTASCRTVQVASTAPFKLQSSELQLLQRSLRASYAFADGPCTAGARQLFWGDVHSTTDHFKALFYFLSAEVVFCQDRTRLDTLPTQSRAALISVVACFLPYYDEPEVFFCYCS